MRIVILTILTIGFQINLKKNIEKIKIENHFD
jgi:hypothetical protein